MRSHPNSLLLRLGVGTLLALFAAAASAQDFDVSVLGNARWEWSNVQGGINDPLYRRASGSHLDP